MIAWAFYDCEQSGPSWCHWSRAYSTWSGDSWNSEEDPRIDGNETWRALDRWGISNSESWNAEFWYPEEYHD